MIVLCSYKTGEEEIAISGIRSICAYYGGQQIYLPRHKLENSEIAISLQGILSDAVGEHFGNIILDELMLKFGGVQVYIPMERRAFRREIAREVKERYDGTTETMRELCREYGFSFTQMYRLWHQAGQDKIQRQFDF